MKPTTAAEALPSMTNASSAPNTPRQNRTNQLLLGRRGGEGGDRARTMAARGMSQRLACVKRTGHGTAIWAFSARAASNENDRWYSSPARVA